MKQTQKRLFTIISGGFVIPVQVWNLINFLDFKAWQNTKTICKFMILVLLICHGISLSSVNMMMLVEILFVGLVLPFANSNYEYDYDPNSNYNSNATIEDCDDKLSENECFCYDEQEADIPYSICKESVLLSGKSSILRLRFYPGQTF